MNHVRVEVSWCSCYTLYSLQGIKQEHQQSRVRISNLLLLFLVFLFPLFFCCVFFFLLFYAKFCLQKKVEINILIFVLFAGRPIRGRGSGSDHSAQIQDVDDDDDDADVCILYLCIAVSVFCCIFLFPLVTAYLSLALSAVRTYLPTVSFRLKGETVAKMPKTCANVPRSTRSSRSPDYYIAICCRRVNAALSANFINLCFCSYQRQPFCLLSPFAFQFQFIFFRFCFVAHPLHTHTHTPLQANTR